MNFQFSALLSHKLVEVSIWQSRINHSRKVNRRDFAQLQIMEAILIPVQIFEKAILSVLLCCKILVDFSLNTLVKKMATMRRQLGRIGVSITLL
jgi:hypothetical protein